MANIAISRIKREFKEVIKSEEVGTVQDWLECMNALVSMAKLGKDQTGLGYHVKS